MRNGASWASKAFIAVACAVALAPLWFLLTGSVQDVHGAMVMPPRLFPRGVTFAQYGWLTSVQWFWRWVGNTAIVAVASAFGSVAISCTAGYAFAAYRIPGKRALWVVLLAGALIPRISLIIPQFVVFSRLGLSGTLIAAILPQWYHPVGLVLSRSFFAALPASIMESARIDGANDAQIVARIIVPLSRAIVATVGVFVATQALGDYLWQMLQLQRPNSMTMLVGLMREAARRGGEIGLVPLSRQMAASVLLLVPMVVVFASATRYFVGSLEGGVRG